MASQKLLEVEKQVINNWCKVRPVGRMLENFALELFK
jgi:hypothetical protein